MNNYIENQLNKCVFATIRQIEQNKYVIPKYAKPKYDIGQCYLIKIAPNIVNNSHSVIATNWNNGSFPKQPYAKAFVSRIKGKMIYVDCLAYDIDANTDLSDMWSGWLSIDDLTQISKIN